MKILVTGATGFVGSHLCDRLHHLGHQVYALARNSKKFKDFKVQGTLVQGELNSHERPQWIHQLPQDLDAVIHTAGIVHSFHAQDFVDINYKASENLFEELKKQYKQLIVLFISSQAAAGPGDNVRESDQANPVSMYGKSKKMVEDYLQLNTEMFKAISLRPPMVIGPRDPAILDVFKMVKSGFFAMSTSVAKNKHYSFINVFDLVELVIQALRHASSTAFLNPMVFHGAYPDKITMFELVTNIQKIITPHRQTKFIPTPFALTRALAQCFQKLHRTIPIKARLTPDKVLELAPDQWILNSELSVSLLDMKYQHNLTSSLEMTYQDYLDRQWL